MRDVIPDLVTILIRIIIVILLGGWLVSCANCVNDSKWNNGYCDCGGKWVYDQPIGHRYDTYFLYECDKCGKNM